MIIDDYVIKSQFTKRPKTYIIHW